MSQARDIGAAPLDNEGARDVTPALWPAPRAPALRDQAVEARVQRIAAAMTVEQKIGQIIQADIGSVTPEDVRAFGLGSILNGGNSAPGGNMSAAPAEWLALADAMWLASKAGNESGAPVIWGSDAVHGNSNVAGATIFPHAINLGAAREADLVTRIGAATALEMAVTGMDWNYAPTLAVVQDVRWGRTYEAFSSDPKLVAELGAALIRGLQGDPGAPDFLGPGKVAATAKHFVGDGGARDGRDQGDTIATERLLRDVHAAGYGPAIEAGVQSIMASFSSWGGRKMHGRADLLTGLIKARWAFDGVVIGDWNAHGQLPGCTPERCPDALNAGLDVYMAPDTWRGLLDSTRAALRAGEITMARLDDAVLRLLRLKARLGLLDKPMPSKRPFAGQFDLLASAAHLKLAREAVRKSAVLLKNDGVLPLKANARILVAGRGANDLSIQCGGWTLSWQGQDLARADFPAAETLLDGIAGVLRAGGGAVEHAPDGAWRERPDAAIVVFGEEPYAEFRGDLETLDYRPGDARDYDLIRKLRAANIPVVAVFLSGRPLWVNPALNASNAFVAAFLPGSQAGALAELLFANTDGRAIAGDFQGRLPFAWPIDADQYALADPTAAAPLFPLGYGQTLAQRETPPPLHERSVATGANPRVLFNLGAAQGGWMLLAEDRDGEQKARAPAFNSPARAVSVHAVDFGQQEAAIAVAWAARRTGRLIFRHAPLDLTRDANAGCCLRLHWLVRSAPKGALKISLSGADSAGALTLDVEAGEAVLELPLNDFAANGADLAQIEAVSFETASACEIVLAKLSLEPQPQGARPGMAKRGVV